MEKIKCLECGGNEIHFCISIEDTDEYTTVDHRGRRIDDCGNVGKKISNLKDYELQLCECHGDCNDEISGEDVQLILNDGTKITGELKCWDYIKNKQS